MLLPRKKLRNVRSLRGPELRRSSAYIILPINDATPNILPILIALRLLVCPATGKSSGKDQTGNRKQVKFQREHRMKIGILGSGNIGATAARLFVAAGHDVAISNSRGPDSLRDLIKELGPQAHAMTARD